MRDLRTQQSLEASGFQKTPGGSALIDGNQRRRCAVSLAQETKAQLMALHVIDTKRDFLLSRIVTVAGWPVYLDHSRNLLLDILVRERTLDLQNFVGQQVKPTSQDGIVKVVRMGSLGKEMATVIREEKIDLLVLKPRTRFLFPDIETLKLIEIARRLSCPALLGSSTIRNGAHAHLSA